MLLAAAERSLGSTELDMFKELMEDFRPRYGERSKLVHNIWGHSNDHPDKAVWCKASDAAYLMAQAAAITNPQQIGALDDLVQDLMDVAARLDEYKRRVGALLQQLVENHPALAVAANASTNAPPIGEESQLDLRPPGQTAPQENQPDDQPQQPDPAA